MVSIPFIVASIPSSILAPSIPIVVSISICTLVLALFLAWFFRNRCEHSEQTVELTGRNEIRGKIKLVDRAGTGAISES